MLVSSRQISFMCILISGTILALSSNSCFMAWVGLDPKLLSSIPLMTTSKSELACEAGLKYFLIQTLGSALVIFPASLMIGSEMFDSSIPFALLLKLGAASFHFWLPAIVDGLNWIQ